MKILFLTQFFWPEARTAPTNLGALAEDLASKGHEVIVVTGFPNHPLGRIYDGYRMRPWQWEERRGVRILRLPLFPDHSMSAVRRMMNYTSFMVSSGLLGSWFTRRFRADLMFVYFAPLTIGLSAAFMNWFRKVPVVYWITDIWPENFRASGKSVSDRAYNWLRRLENWSYDRAHTILVDSPGYVKNLREKGVNADKIHVVAEWADENLFFPVERDPEVGEQFGLAGHFNVIYGGNLGKVQHLETVVEAATFLRHIPEIQVVFIGGGTEADRLKRLADNLSLENVRFIPHQPMEEIHRFFAWADALLVHLQRSRIFELQLPSKVLAYLACGRPILGAVPGAVEQIIKDAGAGVCCPSEDPAAMADSIRSLYQMPLSEREALGQRGREAYLHQYNRQVQVERIERILTSLCE